MAALVGEELQWKSPAPPTHSSMAVMYPRWIVISSLLVQSRSNEEEIQRAVSHLYL